MSNILEQANNIINNRSEEKERQYGPIGAGFERAALIASGISGKDWSAHDMFVAMIALKFSRQSYNFKEDNLLDACSYIGAWQNYIDDAKPSHVEPDVQSEIKNAETKNDKTLLTEENQHAQRDFLPYNRDLHKKVAQQEYRDLQEQVAKQDFFEKKIDSEESESEDLHAIAESPYAETLEEKNEKQLQGAVSLIAAMHAIGENQ
jgi:hypothetical protein